MAISLWNSTENDRFVPGTGPVLSQGRVPFCPRDRPAPKMFIFILVFLLPEFTLWHEIITKIIPWELFFVIFEAFCPLEMSRKERHFQGITREIRNFSEKIDFKIIIFRKKRILCQNFNQGQKRYRKELLRQKDFAELSGESFGAICRKTLVSLGMRSSCSENSLVLFVRFFGFGVLFCRHRVWLDEEVTGRNEVTTTFFYVWPLWCACSFSGCEWAYCHGTLLCEFSFPKCGGVLGGNDQNRAEKQNVVLTSFRPVTWSSSHLGRRFWPLINGKQNSRTTSSRGANHGVAILKQQRLMLLRSDEDMVWRSWQAKYKLAPLRGRPLKHAKIGLRLRGRS